MPGVLLPEYPQTNTRRGVGEYAGANQQNTYTDVSGLRIVARAAAGSTPKVVRVHGDYGMRTVAFDTSRAGRPPIVPKGEDIVSGTVTTDVYMGGALTMPIPSPNEQTGGYNWRVQGAYTYLQTPRRVPGRTALPAGTYPHEQPLQDRLAAITISDNPVAVAPPGTNPTAYVIDQLSARIVDHNTLFTWPFTYLPAQCVVNGLIGG